MEQNLRLDSRRNIFSASLDRKEPITLFTIERVALNVKQILRSAATAGCA
jgi:hypothetical protein